MLAPRPPSVPRRPARGGRRRLRRPLAQASRALRAFAFAGVSAVLALVCLAARPAQADPLRDPAADVRVTKLSNGLQVLTLEDHSTPVASLQIWVHVGSGDEARWTGLAHLFEHMMFRGSKNLPPEAHAKLLENRGASVNAFTSRDVTVFFTDFNAENLPLVVALEAERLKNLDISEESLASERQVVIEERRLRNEDDPEGRVFEVLPALTWIAHPYRVPTVGWMSDLEKVGVAECRHFFDEYYAANNMVIALAGDFDTAEALALLEKSLGDLPASESIDRNPTTEPPQQGPRRAVVNADVQSPIVAMAWHAPATGTPDAEPLDVAGAILSSGRTSRLYRRLVYDAPLAVGASGAYWELERAGLFYAYAAVRPGVDAAKVEAALRHEIARLRDEPVSEAELERARRSLEVDLIEGLGTSHANASRIAQDWLSFGRIRPLDERLAAIRAVDAAAVQRVAREYLADAGVSVVVLEAPPAEGAP